MTTTEARRAAATATELAGLRRLLEGQTALVRARAEELARAHVEIDGLRAELATARARIAEVEAIAGDAHDVAVRLDAYVRGNDYNPVDPYIESLALEVTTERLATYAAAYPGADVPPPAPPVRFTCNCGASFGALTPMLAHSRACQAAVWAGESAPAMYYTPADVLRVIDPAMGTGAHLVETAGELAP